MTHLCVSIFVEDLAAAHAAGAIAAERGATLLEYRIDRFAGGPEGVTELVQRAPLPCVITCRPDWEGGAYEGDDETRLGLFVAAAEAGAHAIDVELKALERDAAFRARIRAIANHGPKLIVSSHDFQTRPADLQRRIRAMIEEPACDVAKIAWTARSLRDNLEAFELIEHRAKPVIALCMGEEGLASRVLAKKFGAYLTFCGLEENSGTAPGQVSLDTMKRLYRWDALREDTRVYGVIGHPVGHSLSPHIHNAGFEATGFNGVYLPMPIGPEYERFKATVSTWLDHAPLHFRGASVTIPHKDNLLRFVREAGGTIELLADRIGAANTLTVDDQGQLHASNTDYAAALDAVCAASNMKRESLAGRRVAVLGAGGAARAVVAGFAHYGAAVTIFNRTAAKAESLAHDFADATRSVTVGAAEALTDQPFEVYINCTPLGMHPHVDAAPMPTWPDALDAKTVVFDTIYNPARTQWLRSADKRGFKTVSGIEMFVRQAAAQFEAWTGRSAPVDVFTEVIRHRPAP